MYLAHSPIQKNKAWNSMNLSSPGIAPQRSDNEHEWCEVLALLTQKAPWECDIFDDVRCTALEKHSPLAQLLCAALSASSSIHPSFPSSLLNVPRHHHCVHREELKGCLIQPSGARQVLQLTSTFLFHTTLRWGQLKWCYCNLAWFGWTNIHQASFVD